MDSILNGKPDGVPRQRRRSRRGRQLCCLQHPETSLQGQGRKYFLHLLSPEELTARGMSSGKARLVINAYPVLVLSDEWLEQLYCPACGQTQWYHLRRAADGQLRLQPARRELWSQVAHVDGLVPNPSVSQFSRCQAHQLTPNRRYFS